LVFSHPPVENPLLACSRPFKFSTGREEARPFPFPFPFPFPEETETETETETKTQRGVVSRFLKKPVENPKGGREEKKPV
jgi:hypothetical protein